VAAPSGRENAGIRLSDGLAFHLSSGTHDSPHGGRC
jgi:hypothetical protein